MIDRLRLRLAFEIIAALFAVTMLATVMAGWVEAEADLDKALRTGAEQLLKAREAAAHGGSRAPASIYRSPSVPDGPVRADLTERFAAIIARMGSSAAAIVVASGPRTLDLALPVRDGSFLVASLVAPRSMFEFSGWTVGAWLAVVVAGIGGLGLLLAHRMTAGLRVLERFVGAPDDAEGLPPLLPETGAAEGVQVSRLLNALRARMGQTVDQRLRVVAMAAHDMRGPLQRMKLRSEFLSDNERTAWLQDVEEVEAICDGAIRIVKNREVAEPVVALRLDEVVQSVAAELRAVMLPVDILRHSAVLVLAQPLGLKRLLVNIIRNAATHGLGARVTVGVDQDHALVVVDDSGPGIPEDLLERVFDPFFRFVPDDRSPVHGSGLGLSIARGIAEEMGGSIRLANRLEGGLRQEIRLPLAPAPVEPGAFNSPDT